MLSIDYNQRYHQGYMANFEGLYETGRVAAIRHTLQSDTLFPVQPKIILDIACGQGRYTPILKEAFPKGQILGMDISPVALKLGAGYFPDNYGVVSVGESLPLANESVDMIFSVETLEHVLDVQATIQEWGRVLKPKGKILFTTPCANKFSLEWLMMYFTGGLLPSADGIGRFRRDESGHLRRLTSHHVSKFFAGAGLKVVHSRFRTHFFTTVAHDLVMPWFYRPALWLASLDWLLLRRFPNGASMVVVGEKL